MWAWALSIDMTIILKATPQNAHYFNNVTEDVFDENIKPAHLTTYLKSPNHIMYIAIHSEKIIGQVRAIIHQHPDRDDELYVDNLGVAPTYKRKGIATQLMHALYAESKTLGCTELWVATEVDNVEAKGFYKSLNLAPETMSYFEGKL